MRLSLKGQAISLNFSSLKYYGLLLVNRLFEHYPYSYFSLIVKGNSLNLIRFQGEDVLETKYFDLRKSESLEDLKNTLKEFSTYPIHILLQGNDTHYRLMSLKSAHWWWDRRAFLKQATENEFSPDYWVKKQVVSVSKDSSKYLLIGLRPSETLKKLVTHLQTFSNPTSAIQLWIEVLAQKIFKAVRSSVNKNLLSKWSIILHKFKPDTWQMIVCQDEAIVLSRQGPLEATVSSINLHHEILTTLRYLNRNDYQEGESITVIQTGFKKENFLENTDLLKVIHLEQNFNENKRNLDYFVPWYKIWKGPTLKIELSPPCFHLPELRSHYLAFILSQWVIARILPFSIFLFFVSTIIFTMNNYAQRKYNFLLEQKMQNILPSNTEVKLKEVEFFEAYRFAKTVNPLLLLQRIGKVFPPYSVATELTWTANEAANNVNFSKMTINLVIDRNLLNRKNSFKEDKNFYLYQEKIKKDLSKFNSSIKLNWGKLNNQQHISLSIEYPLEFEEH